MKNCCAGVTGRVYCGMSSATAIPDAPITFRISPGKMQAYRKRYVITLLVVYGFAGILFTAIHYYQDDGEDAWTLWLPLGIMAVFGGILSYVNLGRQKRMMESYEITWETLTITRRQKDTPDVVLYHGEITGVEYFRKGGLIIKGKNARDLIFVPRHIERYEELKSLLEELVPLQPYSLPRWLVKGGTLVNLAGIVSLLFALYSTNRDIIFWVGTLAIGLNAWSIYSVSRSKNLPSGTKRLRFIRALLLVVLLLRMYSAFTGDTKFLFF